MESSFTLGRILGVRIGLHYTWLLAWALISWSLARGYFPVNYPGWAASSYWITGIASALLLFVSVLAHELCHAAVALARGLTVESITLFIFGGVANIRDESRNARDEFLIAVVGPFASFAVAGLAWLIDLAVPDTGSPLDALLNYLTLVNAVLGLFNLLPGFPLDGGRVLRAAVWGWTQSMARSTRIASYVGQTVALLFIAYGFSEVLDGNVFGGLWIGLIGWFLNSAAGATRRESELREITSGVTVSEIMQRNPPTISPAVTVRELVEDHLLKHGTRAFPVIRNGDIAGIVSLTDVKRLPRERWDQDTVGAIMTRTGLRIVSPDRDVHAALRALVEHNVNQLLVIEDGFLVGMLSRGDVMRYLQMREQLG
ncbi:MAG: site-2 protease family protein [Chloroflexota bacterium]